VEQGQIDQEAGAKQRIKQKLEEMIAQAEQRTEQDAYDLAEALEQQINSGEIEIETEGLKIIIRIREKGSFKTASAELNDDYFDVLDEIREVLRNKAVASTWKDTPTIYLFARRDSAPTGTCLQRGRCQWPMN
jgi:chemotaxis protein MotB